MKIYGSLKKIRSKLSVNLKWFLDRKIIRDKKQRIYHSEYKVSTIGCSSVKHILKCTKVTSMKLLLSQCQHPIFGLE